MRSIAAVTPLALTALWLATSSPASPPAGETTSTPATPQQVQRVESIHGLVGLMNLARGCVRIVAVVSPSAPSADADLDTVLSVMRANPSKRLRAYVVVATPSNATALQVAGFAQRHRLPRSVFLWDAGAGVADAFKPIVGAKVEDVHSVYFLYDTAATLGDSIPAPDMWIHDRPDLGGKRFDVGRFLARAGELVRSIEGKVASDARSQ